MKLISYLMSAATGCAILLAAATGCGSHTYDQDRPPTDSLAYGNTGVQAKDVSGATDQMATDLLSLPELNVSDIKWTIVLSGVKNNTSDPTMSYTVFSARLRSLLSQKGRGRISLIANKADYHAMQNQELENTAPAGVQPDYGLEITIDEMPNRATSYFLISATLTNFKTRELPWVARQYEFQAPR